MDTILLSVPADDRGSGVVSLVLGGLGSRLDLPVDRIDELTLATSVAGTSALDDVLDLEVDVQEERLVVRLGPLTSGASTDPSRRRLLEPLVTGVATVERDNREWLELTVDRRSSG